MKPCHTPPCHFVQSLCAIRAKFWLVWRCALAASHKSLTGCVFRMALFGNHLGTVPRQVTSTVSPEIAHAIRSPQTLFDAQRPVVGPTRRAQFQWTQWSDQALTNRYCTSLLHVHITCAEEQFVLPISVAFDMIFTEEGSRIRFSKQQL